MDLVRFVGIMEPGEVRKINWETFSYCAHNPPEPHASESPELMTMFSNATLGSASVPHPNEEGHKALTCAGDPFLSSNLVKISAESPAKVLKQREPASNSFPELVR